MVATAACPIATPIWWRPFTTSASSAAPREDGAEQRASISDFFSPLVIKATIRLSSN